MDKTKAILAGAGLILAGAVGAPLILGEAEATSLSAEDEAALDEIVAEFGGAKIDHIRARIQEMKVRADARFRARLLRAVDHMRANPDTGFGPQNARWAQVKAALLAAEAAAIAEEPE